MQILHYHDSFAQSAVQALLILMALCSFTAEATGIPDSPSTVPLTCKKVWALLPSERRTHIFVQHDQTVIHTFHFSFVIYYYSCIIFKI